MKINYIFMGKNTSLKKNKKKDKRKSKSYNYEGKHKKANYSSDEDSQSQVSYTSSSISRSREKAKKKKTKKQKQESDTSSITIHETISEAIRTGNFNDVNVISSDIIQNNIDADNPNNDVKKEMVNEAIVEEVKCTDLALLEENKDVETRLVDLRSNFIKLNYQDLPNFHKKL